MRKLVQLLFHGETRTPVLSLTCASGICFCLVVARIIISCDLGYAFLIWNLFLAWLPLILSLMAWEQYVNEKGRLRLGAIVSAWLLFFPNAPYIFTDLVHLNRKFSGHFWIDMILILSCAITGLMLGFISLYLMQSLAAKRFGRIAGWLLVSGTTVLAGIGVFIGRFLRLNSWDVFLQPGQICRRAWLWLDNPMPYAFAALFTVFLLVGYLMFHALTGLAQCQLDRR